jgi:hypothetical protein
LPSSPSAEAALKYDAFTSATLDEKWAAGEMHDASGTRHAYLDPNARIATGSGAVEITIDPFTRFHDSVPILNNPKALFLSRERFLTPPRSSTVFSAEMAIETLRALPGDLRDAFGTFNVLDFETGVVLDFAATNELLFIVFERLLIPGVTTPDQYFTYRIVLEVDTEPGQPHHYAIRYDRAWNRAEWMLDGLKVYEATVPAEVNAFNMAFGLFSSRDIRKYSRAEREHGQGARGWWRNFEVA